MDIADNQNMLLKNLNADSDHIVAAIPDLAYIGNPVLRTKAAPVSVAEGIQIGEKLLVALLAYRKLTGLGVGLAAPQIGISSAVFITYANETPKIYINPEIISYSEDKSVYKECCLSSGHLWCDVVRPKTVTLRYMNEQGETVTEDIEERSARLIQHEYDHLQGVVNIDKATVGTVDYRFGDPKKERMREI